MFHSLIGRMFSCARPTAVMPIDYANQSCLFRITLSNPSHLQSDNTTITAHSQSSSQHPADAGARYMTNQQQQQTPSPAATNRLLQVCIGCMKKSCDDYHSKHVGLCERVFFIVPSRSTTTLLPECRKAYKVNTVISFSPGLANLHRIWYTIPLLIALLSAFKSALIIH